MIETATLITLCMLYLIFFRPGKTQPLQNPLVIERPGQYHLTLAPQLNLAQTFIEGIIGRIVASGDVPQNTGTQFFEVRDKQVTAHGHDFYLLAVTRREGMLYVQAARPVSKESDSQLRTISEFAHKVLIRFPDDEEHASGEKIIGAVQLEAQLRGIRIKNI
ncbi:MAG: hypothetical protein NTY60_05825 [Proteobacteria bacterium]|nr:hypothetical protein [Pseudomonadota bacterium]